MIKIKHHVKRIPQIKEEIIISNIPEHHRGQKPSMEQHSSQDPLAPRINTVDLNNDTQTFLRKQPTLEI